MITQCPKTGKTCEVTGCNGCWKAEQAEQEPVAWKHSCNALCVDNLELYIDQCPHCGTPRTTPPSVEAAIAELQHKYDELLEHYTWQGNQYMEAMRKKSAEIEAAIEATKEKAAKLIDNEEIHRGKWFATAIRSMK